MFITSAYAQTAGSGAQGANGVLGFVLPMILIFAVVYFMTIRPQMKKQKDTDAMLAALSKGDEVVTTGGVLGRITKLGDTYVTLEVAAGTEIQIQRNAILQALPKGTYTNGK